MRYMCFYFVFIYNSIYGNYVYIKFEFRFREDLYIYVFNIIFYCFILYKIVVNYFFILNMVKKVEKVLYVNELVILDFIVVICVLISM